MTQSSLRIHHVQSNQALEEAARALQEHKVIALDTEFVRIDTYYPITGLIQIGCGDACYLIDPLAIDDLSPLRLVLEDRSILKLLHACSEDLEVFRCLMGALPQPVYDTQIGAAMVGQGFSKSYQALVEETLGISIAKGETRSNWIQRPLTDSQCHYAALDVEHLGAIYSLQRALLVETGRYQWMEEECERLLSAANDYPNPEDYYLRVASAWKLDRHALMVLKTLCAWREQEARQQDKPRNHVVRERSLLLVARDMPQDREELKSVAEMSPREIRKYGDRILLLAREAMHVDEEHCPALLKKPLGKEAALLLKTLRAIVVSTAEKLRLAPEMLARKKQLEELIEQVLDAVEPELPPSLDGWRKAVIGDQLMQITRQMV
jgi:ribonuclease D